jgi:hypothetical protein
MHLLSFWRGDPYRGDLDPGVDDDCDPREPLELIHHALETA